MILISLDITGAFDNISHRKIIELFTEYDFPGNLIKFAKSYSTHRMVSIRKADIENSKRIERGCAQSSKCAPDLFMIAMNDFLQILKRQGIRTLAYEDDLMLVLEGHNVQQIAR